MSTEDSKIISQNDVTLPFEMNHLPDFVLKKLREELNETPETKLKSLLELRNMLEGEQLTSGIDFHEDFLIQFLRHSKNDTCKAFCQIRNMFHLRRRYPFMFETMPDEFFLTKESTKFFRILPKRCREGCTIVLFRFAKFNINEMSVECLNQMAVILFSQLHRDPMTQINGVKFIIDFKGTSLQHLKLCTPQQLYLFYHTSIHCIPARFKEIHLINQSFIVKPAWTILKPFLSQKLRNRVYFISNVEELFDFFPRSTLPVEYGGDIKEKIGEDWLRKANKVHENHGVTGQPNFF